MHESSMCKMANHYGSIDRVQLVNPSQSETSQAPVLSVTATSADKLATTANLKKECESTGGGEASYLRYEVGQTSLRDVTRRKVMLPNNIYIKTNFYIQQSRQYFKEHTLKTFFYFRGMQWCYLVILILSLLAPTSSVYAFLCLAVNVLFTVIWSKHMIVIIFTMPLVLSQPVVLEDGPNSRNKHLQISVQQHQADIRVKDGEAVHTSSGRRRSGKFQAFNSNAVMIMKKCIVVSITSFVACITMLVYCTACGLILALKGQS